MKIRRGIKAILVFGPLGFVATFLVGLLFTAGRLLLYSKDPFDIGYDLRLVPVYVGAPALAVALVFAAAGWASYAPDVGRPRFARTLVVVSAISLASWLVLANVLELPVVQPRRIHGVDIPRVAPTSALLFSLAPVATAIILSRGRSRASSIERKSED